MNFNLKQIILYFEVSESISLVLGLFAGTHYISCTTQSRIEYFKIVLKLLKRKVSLKFLAESDRCYENIPHNPTAHSNCAVRVDIYHYYITFRCYVIGHEQEKPR